MANSGDNYQDLKELGIDCEETNDSLTDTFNLAANHLQKLLPNVDNHTLLTLYGYYKQGTDGVCKTPKPSWFDMRAKSKWETWNKLGNMSQTEAKNRYIDIIKKLDPTFENENGNESSFKESWVKVSTMQNNEPSSGTNSIFDCIKEGNLSEVVDYLDKCADVNLLDENGMGLIHWAADGGKVNILEVLISSGANVNLLDSYGQTALHYASSCGQVECIRLLICKGAMTDQIDCDGMTAAEVALDDTVKELFK